MQTIIVDLAITAEEYLKHYQYSGAIVTCHCRDGRKVHFPASILQRFVTHSGIKGSFEISFDADNKFQSVTQIA